MQRLSRAERRDQTRDLLLDAAEREFARRGFHGASLDAIAAGAGFTKGAVYSNFPGKDALFLALLDRRRAALERELSLGGFTVESSAGRPGAPPPADDPWGILTIEFFLYAVRNPEARAAFAGLYAATRRAVAIGIERSAAGPLPPGLSAMDVATSALALSTGLGVQAALELDAVPRDLQARVMAVLLNAGPASGVGSEP